MRTKAIMPTRMMEQKDGKIEDHGSPAHFPVSFFWFLRGTPCQFHVFLVRLTVVVPCRPPLGELVSQADQSENTFHQPKCLVQGWLDRALRVFPGNDMWSLLGLLKWEDMNLGILGILERPWIKHEAKMVQTKLGAEKRDRALRTRIELWDSAH